MPVTEYEGYARRVLDDAVAWAAPAERLLAADQDADLLVVGSRGHGGFVGVLLGSVGQHCSTHATCSAGVVREPGEPRGRTTS